MNDNDINRNLYHPGEGLPNEAQVGKERAKREQRLDIAHIEGYLGRCAGGDMVTIDATHLAQLCTEVWEHRRRERNERERVVGDQARANRLAERAVTAIANVGHSRSDDIKPMEATAIVVVANLLAELLKRREAGADSVMLVGGVVSGSKAAINYVQDRIAELMEWREGRRRPDSMGARQWNGIGAVYGGSEALKALDSQLAELEDWRTGRRVCSEQRGARAVHETLVNLGWKPPQS